MENQNEVNNPENSGVIQNTENTEEHSGTADGSQNAGVNIEDKEHENAPRASS